MILDPPPAQQGNYTQKTAFSLSDLQGAVDDFNVTRQVRALRRAAADGANNVDETKAKNFFKKIEDDFYKNTLVQTCVFKWALCDGDHSKDYKKDDNQLFGAEAYIAMKQVDETAAKEFLELCRSRGLYNDTYHWVGLETKGND